MEETLTKQYNEELLQSRQVTGDTLELEFKRAELARVQNVHAMIASRIVELQTERRAPARIELLTIAGPPNAPVESLPFKHMVLAGGVGLCLPMFLAIGVRISTASRDQSGSMEDAFNASRIGRGRSVDAAIIGGKTTDARPRLQ